MLFLSPRSSRPSFVAANFRRRKRRCRSRVSSVIKAELRSGLFLATSAVATVKLVSSVIKAELRSGETVTDQMRYTALGLLGHQGRAS